MLIPYYTGILYPIIEGISTVMSFHVMKLQHCNYSRVSLQNFYLTDTVAAFDDDSVDIYSGLESPSPRIYPNAGKYHSNIHIGSSQDGLSQIYIFRSRKDIYVLSEYN